VKVNLDKIEMIRATTASLLGFVMMAGMPQAYGQTGAGENLPPPYDQCNATDYYSDLLAAKPNVTTWTRNDVTALMIENHRRILDNVAEVEGDDDIFVALVDLFPGETRETVRLVYRDVDFAALPAGSPNTWKREDLWPISRGALRSSPALTDVHSKIPADATVLITKGDLFFGECDTVQPQASCRSPATVESAVGSEYDGKIFAPPPKSRGDIARSLFYTQLRYSETLGLILTDCPPFRPTEFGYLSTLLKWHMDDPVSPEEEARNDRKCSRWQGNRNPFVDYPQLVTQFFGTPDTIAPGTNTFSNCLSIATSSPTATPNACSTIRAGDIPFFLMNSDDPDQIIFYTLADIDEDIEFLYVTDNAWNGERFVETEGVMRVSE
jgi:endonuclease I